MRRWISEPLLAGAIAIALYLAWMLVYASQLANSGVTPSGGLYYSGWSFVVHVVGGVAVVAIPVTLWAALAMVGGYLVRRRRFVHRLLVAWLAAVVLCLPFAVGSAVSLSANDGWRGLGAIGFLLPIAATIGVVPLYSIAAGMLYFERRRGSPPKRSDAMEN